MRAKLLIAVCALALGAAGGWFANRPSAPLAPEPPAQASAPAPLALAPMPRPARNERVIPLAAVYGTGSQKNVPLIPNWDGFEDGQTWLNLRDTIRGPSQRAFVVNAPTIKAAGEQVAGALRGFRNPDYVNLEAPLEKNTLWAFVSFGSLPGAPAREVLSIHETDDTLTLNYQRHFWIDALESPLHAFFVPLGPTKSRCLTIRLFDVDRDQFTYSVQVDVGTAEWYASEMLSGQWRFRDNPFAERFRSKPKPKP